RQLADLAYRVEGKEWPAPLVARILRLTELGEKAAVDPLTFAWTARLLEEAGQARHHAEICLWARGYASLNDVEKFAQTAEDIYKAALAQAGLVRHAHGILEEALALLPFYVPYLEADDRQQKHWDQAATAARALAETLASPPSWEKGRNPVSIELAHEKIAEVQRLAERLAGQLESLTKPFAKENISQLEKLSRTTGSSPTLAVNLEALLSVPVPSLKGQDRAALWGLTRELARKLHEETVQLDREDDRQGLVTAPPGPYQEEIALQEEIIRSRRRAQTMLALLDLGGMS